MCPCSLRYVKGPHFLSLQTSLEYHLKKVLDAYTCYSHAAVLVPPLNTGCLLIFQVSSLWFIPFAFVFAAKTAYTLAEDVVLGNTLRGWWNLQRMVMIRRTTSYFFALIDTIISQLGLSQTAFVLTAKVVDDEAEKRYKKGLMEFGSSSIMMVIIATLALLNLFSLGLGIKKALFSAPEALEKFIPQLTICGTMVMLNLPIYEALFFRSDKGSIPSSVTFKSFVIASIAVLISVY